MTPPPTHSMTSERRRLMPHVCAVAVIVAATLAAFWPSLFNGLTVWDDDVNITDNPYIRSLSADNIHWMFFSYRHGHYQPLTWLSFAVDHAVFGGSAFGYHVTNLVVHVLTAVAFYMLIGQLLRRARENDDAVAIRANPRHVAIAAAAGALVFAVHPLRVESVAWATERRDVLSGLFFVLTLSSYLRMTGARGGGRAAWYCLALVLYAAALLSKVMVVSLPPVLLLLDLYPLRRIRIEGRWVGKAAWLLLEKAPFFALGFAASAMAVKAQTGADTMLTFADYGLLPRVRQLIFGYGFYAFRTLIPVDLSPLYELHEPIPFASVGFLASLLFVMVTTAICLLSAWRRPAFIVVWLAYLVILFPVSGLFQNGPQIVAERYSYLSCMGFAVLVAGGLVALLMKRKAQGAIAVVLCAAAIVSLGALTWKTSRLWVGDESLWRRAVLLDPASGLGRFNLAKTLADRGEHADAIALYEAIIEDRPGQARTHYAYANSLAAVGRLDDAIKAYQRAIACNPKYLDALNNLGSAYMRTGRSEQAIAAFRAALRIAPDYATARFNLGRVLLESGRTADAVAALQTLVEQHPNHMDGRCQLAFALADEGKPADAIRVLREGLKIRPASTQLQGALALFLATAPDVSLRDGAEAARLARQVIEARGDRDPVAFGTLAAGLAEMGRFDEAVTAAEKAAGLAEQQGDPRLAAEIRTQLSRYRQGLRYSLTP